MTESGLPSTVTIRSAAVRGTMNGIIGVTRTSDTPAQYSSSRTSSLSSNPLCGTSTPSSSLSAGHTNAVRADETLIR